MRNEWVALSSVEKRSPNHTVAASSRNASGMSSKANATPYMTMVKTLAARNSSGPASPSSAGRGLAEVSR